MARNFFYRAVCVDGRGWDAIGPAGVWGSDFACGADRIFATAREAWALVRETRDAGCWSCTDDDGVTREDRPVLTVVKCSVYEALWMDEDDDADEIDAILDIHGGPIRFEAMPRHVADFLIAKFSGASRAWRRESASLAGASSATHTAALIGGIAASRADEVRALLDRRAHV